MTFVLLVELPFVCLFVVGFSHVGWGSCLVVAGGASEFCAFGGIFHLVACGRVLSCAYYVRCALLGLVDVPEVQFRSWFAVV